MSGRALNVSLEASLDRRLRRLADARSTSTEQLIGQAVEVFVAQEEGREELDRATLDAWDHYRATGLHLTQEEVEAWFDKVLEGREAKLPECHT